MIICHDTIFATLQKKKKKVQQQQQQQQQRFISNLAEAAVESAIVYSRLLPQVCNSQSVSSTMSREMSYMFSSATDGIRIDY
jgi:F0F1-type ATP synthase membrane subunit b/b'